jgi:hypothetical protein
MARASETQVQFNETGGWVTNASDTQSDTKLTVGNIAWGDPLLRRLCRTDVSPLLLGIAYTVLFNVLRGFSAWSAGYLFTSGTVTGFFNDPSVYTNFIMGLAIFTYYTWIPKGIVAVFAGLEESAVIGEAISAKREEKAKYVDYPALAGDMASWFGRWWWPAASLVISTVVTLTMVLPQYLRLGQSAWWTAATFPLIVCLGWFLIGFYCVLLILFYSILSIFWLKELFDNFAINIRPLYPDRAGGLASLGGFTLKLSYMIALIGMILVVTPVTRNYVAVGTVQFRWTPELLAGLVVYAIAAPIVFFAPLSVAHNAMRKAKHQLLMYIAQRFDAEYGDIHSVLEDDLKKLEHRSKVLAELESLHKMTSAFPVWPFNVENVTRFGTAYVLPLLVPLLVELSGLLINP